MPRGGGRVAPEELMTLKTWIAEGADFDGPDANVALSSLAPSGGPAAAQPLEVTRATGNEQVSFALHLAPVLVDSCSGCHVNPPQQAEGRLNMSTFQQLLRGGESGPMIRPGMPEASLLIGKLRGTAGRQMPRGGQPLTSDVIARFETWIAEGAKFDGADAAQQIRRIAARAQAAAATHQQLSQNRLNKSLESWRLSLPNIDPDQVETDHFLLLGNVGAMALAEYAEQVQALVPQLARIFGTTTSQPLVKGRTTLFFFQQRYDYGEFGKMVEQRQLPAALAGHWRFNVVDAYAALVPSQYEEESIEAELARHIASVHIASLSSDVPIWFAEGSGRVAVARLGLDRVRVADWERRLSSVLIGMNRPDDFLNDRLPREKNDLASFGFVKYLMSDSRRHASLLNALRDGIPFARAFALNYGGTPADIAEFWLRSGR